MFFPQMAKCREGIVWMSVSKCSVVMQDVLLQMDDQGCVPAALSRQLWPGCTLCCLTRVQDQTALTKTANPASPPHCSFFL